MSNTVATHIPENCKDEFLRILRINEENIRQTKDYISSAYEDTLRSTSSIESAAAYSARLTGYVSERSAICRSLRVLGLSVVWNGEHPESIIIDE